MSVLSGLTLSLRVIMVFAPFHAAEIPEVDWVFFLAFFAEDHLVTRDIREHSLYKITAERTVNVTHGEADCFGSGAAELLHGFGRNGNLLVIGANFIHAAHHPTGIPFLWR